MPNLNYGTQDGIVNDTENDIDDTKYDTILKLMKENPDITTEEISKRMRLSRSIISRKIKLLKEAGNVDRSGSYKKGCWNVIDLKNDTKNDADEIKKDTKEDRLLTLMRECPDIITSDIALKTGLSRATIQRKIKLFKEDGTIVRVGSKRSGTWQVKK